MVLIYGIQAFWGIEGCWAQICYMLSSKMADKASNGEIQDGRLWQIYVHIFFTKHGKNMNKMCFVGFHI